MLMVDCEDMGRKLKEALTTVEILGAFSKIKNSVD
jgi:hypothetical protein